MPLVVQAVTARDLNNLNIREFRDIQTTVPGLTLATDANGIGNRATLRGVAYDVNASGNNGTIEFYFNESPITAALLFQSIFDVGQIEVLRGPQGTLRGRASPSGSITVTSQQADLSDLGATGNATITGWAEANLQAAVNLPIVRDKLAIRFAGVYDDNDDNRVLSINNPARPNRQTYGGRVSLRFDPIDDLKLTGSITHSVRKTRNFLQTEAANVADSGLPASPVPIDSDDRRSTLRVLNRYKQEFTIYNWAAQYSAFGQTFNYVGSHNRQHYTAFAPNDPGAALPATAPAAFLAAAQVSDLRPRQTNHEARISSGERIFGIFDYVIGALWNKLDNPTALEVQTPVFRGSTAVPLLLNRTAVFRDGGSRERSFFGNVTANLGDRTEVSGGIRRIRYRSFGSLLTNGVAIPAANEDRVLHATIYSASLKHNFTRDVMAYFNFGTSWRPGSASNAIQTRGQSNITGTLARFLFPDPETSKSYEVGVKTQWLGGRLRINADVFRQTFNNFGYAAPNVFYLTNTNGIPGVGTIATLATGVPATVRGAEGEIAYRITAGWDVTATLAYSKGKINGATIPCNNYGGVVPTPAQLLAATGGQQIAVCDVDGLRSGTNSPFAATVQSEYRQSLTPSFDGYLRGLLTYSGRSLNDPLNRFDDIRAYPLFNFYVGIRAPNSAWEFGAYVKNAFDVDRTLTRNATAAPSLATVAGGVPPVSAYRVVSTTLPREVGLTARLQFGSR
ncbi:MAG: TonB-dependent receptor [Sphingobium sp.]